MTIRELPRGEWLDGLDEIPKPPERLWIRGSVPDTSLRRLTVVGSRAMTRYGEEACRRLIEGLAGYPVCIVSGLALGIDTVAHKAALAAGLHTLAIPGSGLDDEVLYPRANLTLAHEILKRGGGLLSEYPSDAASRKHFFPERNRLMVGIAHAVLMIEAGERSGTLITARLAGEYNRDLLCIPHRIGDPHAFGPHLFLRLGATLVTEPMHILEALRIPLTETTTKTIPTNLSDIERDIYELLEEALSQDDVLRGTSLAAADALTALMSLEVRGLIQQQYGSWRRVY